MIMTTYKSMLDEITLDEEQQTEILAVLDEIKTDIRFALMQMYKDNKDVAIKELEILVGKL